MYISPFDVSGLSKTKFDSTFPVLLLQLVRSTDGFGLTLSSSILVMNVLTYESKEKKEGDKWFPFFSVYDFRILSHPVDHERKLPRHSAVPTLAQTKSSTTFLYERR